MIQTSKARNDYRHKGRSLFSRGSKLFKSYNKLGSNTVAIVQYLNISRPLAFINLGQWPMMDIVDFNNRRATYELHRIMTVIVKNYAPL